MERTVGALEARRNFGKILREVEANRGHFVVERNGEAVAAVVPIELYRRWVEEREALFSSMRESMERANLSDEEALSVALEAQRAIRSQS